MFQTELYFKTLMNQVNFSRVTSTIEKVLFYKVFISKLNKYVSLARNKIFIKNKAGNQQSISKQCHFTKKRISPNIQNDQNREGKHNLKDAII